MSHRVKKYGQYVVADENVCHGKPTFRGTRVIVGDVLEQVASGMTWDEIVNEWNGRVTKEAIAEAVTLSSQAWLKNAELLRMALTNNQWWDETGVLAYLESIPTYDKESYSYEYVTRRKDLTLKLVIAPYDAYVAFSIWADDTKRPVIEIEVPYCNGIDYINDQRGEYLEFAPGRFARGTTRWPYYVRLYAKTSIAVQLIESDSS